MEQNQQHQRRIQRAMIRMNYVFYPMIVAIVLNRKKTQSHFDHLYLLTIIIRKIRIVRMWISRMIQEEPKKFQEQKKEHFLVVFNEHR